MFAFDYKSLLRFWGLSTGVACSMPLSRGSNRINERYFERAHKNLRWRTKSRDSHGNPSYTVCTPYEKLLSQFSHFILENLVNLKGILLWSSLGQSLFDFKNFQSIKSILYCFWALFVLFEQCWIVLYFQKSLPRFTGFCVKCVTNTLYS